MWKEISQRFRRAKQRFKAIRERRKGRFYSLSHDLDGITIRSLTLENETVAKKLPWNEISSIHAFKRDLMTVDLICIQIVLCDGTVIKIHEEMEGWMELIENLPNYLPKCKRWETWWMVVAFPAFVTNYTELYNRQIENTN